jgi:hypothetical protein
VKKRRGHMKCGGQKILDALLDLPGKYGWDHMNSFMEICGMAAYIRSKTHTHE